MNSEYDTMSDEEILALSVTKPQCFEALVDRYQDAFLRKAQYILKSREDAEDVVQDAFTKIYLNADRFQVQEGASFKSWAYRIVINTALTLYQKKKRHNGAVMDLDPEFYEMLPDTKTEYEAYEIHEYVVSILTRMPGHFARVLELHLIERRSHREIAEIEGSTEGAVKTRVHRAKKLFKEVAASLTT